MRKLIAAINVTVDGFCDHTAVVADDDLHEHYNDLLRNCGVLIYGRTTYQLMESYWPAVVKEPTGDKSTDEFAVLIDNLEKIVFSRTLKKVTWQHSILKHEIKADEITALKQQPGKDISVGSPSLIVALAKLNLIDELQLCVHPVIAGKGLLLFKELNSHITLKLLKTKTLGSGAIVLYYACDIPVSPQTAHAG